MLWNRLPWLSKSVAGGRRLFVNLDTCQRYIYLYICWFFCTKRTSKSQRFKRGGSTIVLNVKRFHISAAFERGFDFKHTKVLQPVFQLKIGFMYCIVYFVPAKSVDYHPRYVTQRLLFLFKFSFSSGEDGELPMPIQNYKKITRITDECSLLDFWITEGSRISHQNKCNGRYGGTWIL